MYTKVNELIADYSCPIHHDPITPKQLAILDAALALFSEKGYTATTTLEIAKKAQTSEKTLFKYFPTKQILFNHIFYPSLINMLNQDTPIDATEADSLYTLLYKLFQEKIALSDDNPELFKLLIHQTLHDQRFRTVFYNYWNTVYLPSLENHVQLSDDKKAYYNDVLHPSLSRIIFSLMIGYSISKNIVNATDTYDNEKEISLMLDILFNGLNGLSHPL